MIETIQQPQTASDITRRALQVPWALFLFCGTVFFFAQHDIAYSKSGIDNYNLPTDDFVVVPPIVSEVHRILVTSLGIVAIASLIRFRSELRFYIHRILGWLSLAFMLLVFLSPLWANDVATTTKRVEVFGVMCVAAISLARRCSLRAIILWTFLTTAVYLVIGIAAEIHFGSFQPLASGYRFEGTMHPNSEGVECGILVLSAVATATVSRGRKVVFWTCACLGFFFLALTRSRTALASTVFGFTVYLVAVSSRTQKRVAAFSLSLLACAALFLYATGVLPTLTDAVQLGRSDDGSDAFLTGRGLIWNELGAYVRQRPLLGYGYEGFWTPAHIDVISSEIKGQIMGSHSAYVECLLSLGALGLVTYTASLLGGSVSAFRRYTLSRDPEIAFCGMFLLFYAVEGISESISLFTLPMFLWMVVLGRLAFLRGESITEHAFYSQRSLDTCGVRVVPRIGSTELAVRERSSQRTSKPHFDARH